MPHPPLIVWILFGASVVSIRILLFVERWIVNAPAEHEDEVFELQLPRARTIRAAASPPQPVTPGEP